MRRLDLKSCNGKKGQIWVETVIYTLIGIAIIGIVLAVAKPKIDQKKDEIVIEQAIESLGNIDDKIYEVQKAVGNRRSIDLKIGKGNIVIDGDADTVSWELESSFEYSEEGVPISLGRIEVLTTSEDPWKVKLTAKYDVEVLYAGRSTDTQQLDAAPLPYNLVVENKGVDETSGKLKVDISEA